MKFFYLLTVVSAAHATYDEYGCSETEFTCSNRLGMCIPESWVCDGEYDCHEWSDEENCTCSHEQFTCGNGLCIPDSWVCDEYADCNDLSDELNCTCNEEQFICGNGMCIHESAVCNGWPDCSDLSDERNCTCNEEQFTCSSGGCIHESWVCDGYPDCNDSSDGRNSSDEMNCTFNGYHYDDHDDYHDYDHEEYQDEYRDDYQYDHYNSYDGQEDLYWRILDLEEEVEYGREDLYYRILALEDEVEYLREMLIDGFECSDGYYQDYDNYFYDEEINNRTNIRICNGGLLEVFDGSSWGTVCDDYFDFMDADVACRQLGFSGASNYFTLSWSPLAPEAIHFDNMECYGSENSLFECPNDGLGIHNCNHYEDVGLECIGAMPEANCYADNMDSSTGSENVRICNGGLLEVFDGSSWGTVCDDNFDFEDANVACRQLGFSGAITYYTIGNAGGAMGPIHLDDLDCNGFESSLLDCPSRGLGNHNCGHNEDVALDCEGAPEPQQCDYGM